MPAMTPVVGQRSAFEPGEDQVALRADDVLDDADDVGFELLDARAFEDRVADADHARPDFRDTHLRGGGAQRSQPEEARLRENASLRGVIKAIPL